MTNSTNATNATTGYNFQPVTDFRASLEGATRLLHKGVKLINRFSNIRLNPEDVKDGISTIYIAVVEYTPTENDTPLAEVSQAYFGIKTREQFRAGYNALQKMIYSSRTKGAPEYSQEFGLDGTAAKDEHAEIELDILLQEILSEKLNTYLEYYLQGYKQKEIAEIMGVSQNIPTKYLKQCQEIIAKALNYKN